MPLDPNDVFFHIKKNRFFTPTPGPKYEEITQQALDQILRYNNINTKKFRAHVRPILDHRRVFSSKARYIEIEDNFFILNLYTPTEIIPTPGSWNDIEALIKNIASNDLSQFNILMDWLAKPLQSLHEEKGNFRWKTALVLAGIQASGRVQLLKILELLYHPTNYTTKVPMVGDYGLIPLIDPLLVVINENTTQSLIKHPPHHSLYNPEDWIKSKYLNIPNKGGGHSEITPNFIFLAQYRASLVETSFPRYYIQLTDESHLPQDVVTRIEEDLAGPRTQLAAFYDALLKRNVTLQIGKVV